MSSPFPQQYPHIYLRADAPPTWPSYTTEDEDGEPLIGQIIGWLHDHCQWWDYTSREYYRELRVNVDGLADCVLELYHHSSWTHNAQYAGGLYWPLLRNDTHICAITPEMCWGLIERFGR